MIQRSHGHKGGREFGLRPPKVALFNTDGGH